MGEGLKYVFEVDGESSGLDKMIQGLEIGEKLVVKLNVASEKASKGHKKHGEEAKGLGGVLNRLVHQSMEPFLHKAKEIAEFEFIRRGVDALIEAPFEIAEKFKELGEEMITVAAKTERTNKSFELLFGMEGGNEVLEYLEGIAGAMEFTDDRLKGAAQSLAKVGFSGEGLNRALAASLDIAAFDPNKEEGLSSALFALEQAKRTGQVSNRTLKPLGIGEDDFFKQLSKRTGDDVASLKKKMAAGKVDAEDALETLYTMISKKTDKDLGGAGLEMGKTLEARLTHLKDLPEQFFQKLAKTDAFKTITEQAGKLLEALDPESPNGKRIFGALENVFTTIGDLMKTFDMASVVTSAIDALETFSIMFLELLSLIPGETGDKASYVRNEMKKRRETNARDAEERKTMAAMGTTPEFELAADLADLDNAVFEKAGAKAGSAIVAGARGPQGIDAHSPSKKFQDLGEMAAEGFGRGASGAVDDVMAGAFAVPAPHGGRSIGGGPISISIGDIVVTTAAGANANETAVAVRAEVHATMMELMENMRSEQGA